MYLLSNNDIIFIESRITDSSLATSGVMAWHNLVNIAWGNGLLPEDYRPLPEPALTNHEHDDVIKWKNVPRYWSFVRVIHQSPVNSPHKGHWRRALVFYFVCAWINCWVNNREADDLRRHRASATSQEMLDISLLNIGFKIDLILQPHLPGPNELITSRQVYVITSISSCISKWVRGPRTVIHQI